MYVDGVSMYGVLFHSARITLVSMTDASAFSSLVSDAHTASRWMQLQLLAALNFPSSRSRPFADRRLGVRNSSDRSRNETKPRHGSPTSNSSSLRQLTMVEMFFKGINVASVGWADAIVCGLRSRRRYLQASLLARYALTY